MRIGVAIAAAYFTAGAVSSLIIQGAANSALAASGSLVVSGIAAHAASMAVSTAIISGAAGGFVGGLIVSGGDLKMAGIGALTGGAFGFVGAHHAFGTGLTAQRIAAHGIIGGTASVLQGGKFATGLATGAFAKIATPISNFVSSQGNAILGAMSQAVVGGTVSIIGGGKFANGAKTAAFAYLFNEMRGTLISLGYTRTLPRISNHAALIACDTYAGNCFATRAGPALDLRYTAAGFTVYLRIDAVAAPFDNNFRDPPSSVHTYQNLGILTVSPEAVNNTLTNFASQINASQYTYGILVNNSNSFSFTAPELFGLPRPQPEISAWGHANRLLPR